MRGAMNIYKPVNDGQLVSKETFNDENYRLSTNALAVLSFIGYLIIGMLYFCYSDAQLTALDSIYLSVITFTTVGYGDISIGTHRHFATFYVLLGAGLLGSFFGIFSNDVMESQETAMKKRLVQAATKMNHVISKTAEQLRKYQQKKISQLLTESNAVDEHGNAVEQSTFKKAINKMFLERLHRDTIVKMEDMNIAIYDEELAEVRSKGIVDFSFVLVSVFVGAISMMFMERWTFEDSIYWACVTITTVGYGDVTPKTEYGKVFTILYTLTGCALAAKGFRDIVCYPMLVREKEHERLITAQFGDEISEKTLKSILYNEFFNRIPNLRRDEKQLTKSEFVLLLLQMMGKLQEKDVLIASKIFDKLDMECDGVLTEADQQEEMRKARLRDQNRILEQQRREAELAAQQQAQKSSAPQIITGFTNALSGAVSILTSTSASPMRTSHFKEEVNQTVELSGHSQGKRSRGSSISALTQAFFGAPSSSSSAAAAPSTAMTSEDTLNPLLYEGRSDIESQAQLRTIVEGHASSEEDLQQLAQEKREGMKHVSLEGEGGAEQQGSAAELVSHKTPSKRAPTERVPSTRHSPVSTTPGRKGPASPVTETPHQRPELSRGPSSSSSSTKVTTKTPSKRASPPTKGKDTKHKLSEDTDDLDDLI